jgi:hypothetical protein
MRGRATSTRQVRERWITGDLHGDSEIPRPSDEGPQSVDTTSPVAAQNEGDHGPEYWHG